MSINRYEAYGNRGKKKQLVSGRDFSIASHKFTLEQYRKTLSLDTKKSHSRVILSSWLKTLEKRISEKIANPKTNDT
jgi:hypothetical protein